MYIKLGLLFITIVIASNAKAEEVCRKASTKYYSWAELKRYPPFPTQEQPADWAKKREELGQAYYIAEYCEDDKIIKLTKRLDKKVFFEFRYIYKNDRLVAVDNGNKNVTTIK